MISYQKKPNKTLNNISRILLLAAIILFTHFSNVFAETNDASAAQGVADLITVEGNQIIAQGWAGPDKATQQVASISVWLADEKIYDGGFERYERPDVAKVTHRNDWLRSGWRLKFSVPDNIKTGNYPTKILVKLDTGKIVNLALNESSKSLFIDGSVHKGKHLAKVIKLTIALTLIFTLVIFFKAENIATWLNSKTGRKLEPFALFGSSLIFVFVLFLSLGITGSSLKYGLSQAPYIKAEITNISGNDQGIRSDEWLVLTPLAIAQFNHTPANPVINTNHGEDGQNMLIVGMTGVPVEHISAIAKPATWGYFIFDLKRALSWNWLFPIFSCLLALWAVVNILMPGNWKSSFLISLLFSTAPYVVAWSNWPAYVVFFPCLIFVCSIAILRSHKPHVKFLLACLLGIAFAGFVFVLYPPWQVSLAYIFIALSIGVVIRDKLHKNINILTILSFSLALIIAGVILGLWWIDARTAIQAMENTVYPGQRTTVVGGTMSLPTLLRGFTNIITLQKLDSPYSNQSEIASFSYLLIPLAILFCTRLFQKSISALEATLAFAIVFILVFMFFGVPTDFAKYSLWGRVPANRADLALGLASILLSGLMLNSYSKNNANERIIKIISFVGAFLWAYISYKSIQNLNDTILAGFNPSLMLALFMLITALGYFLSSGRFNSYILLSLAFSISTTFSFNPINIAPNSVISTHRAEGPSDNKSDRVLVLENMTPAMYLVASGTAVANGIFYYPQQSLWSRLDQNGTETDTYNRYQHLTYSGGTTENLKNYNIETPRPDVVKIVVSLESFDFSKTGATLVTAPISDESALNKNTSLVFSTKSNGWVWYSLKTQH
ncbi:DUF7657 domain-containing protein [Pseudomonas lini]